MPDILRLTLTLALIGCGPSGVSSGSTSDSSTGGGGDSSGSGSDTGGDGDGDARVDVPMDLPGDAGGDGDGDGDGDGAAGPWACGSDVCELCGDGLSLCVEPITVICEFRTECAGTWLDACDFYGC